MDQLAPVEEPAGGGAEIQAGPDPRGDEYTPESIGERLSIRNFMDGLRSSGVETGGHAAYGPREKQAFANALDRLLTHSLRQR